MSHHLIATYACIDESTLLFYAAVLLQEPCSIYMAHSPIPASVLSWF